MEASYQAHVGRHCPGEGRFFHGGAIVVHVEILVALTLGRREKERGRRIRVVGGEEEKVRKRRRQKDKEEEKTGNSHSK